MEDAAWEVAEAATVNGASESIPMGIPGKRRGAKEEGGFVVTALGDEEAKEMSDQLDLEVTSMEEQLANLNFEF